MNLILFLQQNATELIAGFAVIVSIYAGREARRANKRANWLDKEMKIAAQAERRTDILVEIERKNSAIGRLSLITARKTLLLQQHPKLAAKHIGEIDRLINNLGVIQKLQNGEEGQRKISELVGGGTDVRLHQKSLADIKRLQVTIEGEIEKETAIYEELVKNIT